MNAVCLLSGGQDSTTCLYHAKREYEEVTAISFDYGQRHVIELDQAGKIAELAEVPWVVMPIEALKMLGGSSLTNMNISNFEGEPDLRNRYAEERGLPPSFTPGRNAIFFSLAAAYAAPRGFEVLVSGVCQQDRSGYPDCREEFVETIEGALRVALDLPAFTIDAPLLHRDKAETWALADELGVLPLIVELTHTCYEGNRELSHPWGLGCGECAACIERAKGFERFRAGAVA